MVHRGKPEKQAHEAGRVDLLRLSSYFFVDAHALPRTSARTVGPHPHTAKMATSFTKLAGIRYPIIQAPIGSATTPMLAAAVSNAGALGTLSITWRPIDKVRQVISDTSALTTCPFAVNVVLAWPQERRIALALEAGARLVWTFWGDPTPHVAQVHAAGGYLMHSVGSVDEAIAVTAAGVDVIVAQGVEAGGHVRGTTPWRILLDGILKKLPDLPVLVAGGIADARDVAEALATGAAGACLGTRFLCCTEANVARSIKSEFSMRRSATPSSLICLIKAGPTLHIGCCATVLCVCGKQRAVPARASDLVSVTRSAYSRTGLQSSDTQTSSPPLTCRATWKRSLSMLARALSGLAMSCPLRILLRNSSAPCPPDSIRHDPKACFCHPSGPRLRGGHRLLHSKPWFHLG